MALVGGYMLIAPPSLLHRTHGVIGNGHCVALVRELAGAPHTSAWRPGRGLEPEWVIPPGVAIATFQTGRYRNRTNGDSHAALFLAYNSEPAGIAVLDQWLGRAPERRVIRWRNGAGKPADDASAYRVIELEQGASE